MIVAKSAGIGVTVCLLALPSGAARPAPEPGPPAQVLTRRADQPVGPEGVIGWQALVSGTVGIADGCLLLSIPTMRTVVVWPHGTRWSRDGQDLTMPDGGTLEVGDQVQGGGGYAGADRRFLQWLVGDTTAERVVSCVRRTSARGVAVFNSYALEPLTRVRADGSTEPLR